MHVFGQVLTALPKLACVTFLCFFFFFWQQLEWHCEILVTDIEITARKILKNHKCPAQPAAGVCRLYCRTEESRWNGELCTNYKKYFPDFSRTYFQGFFQVNRVFFFYLSINSQHERVIFIFTETYCQRHNRLKMN